MAAAPEEEKRPLQYSRNVVAAVNAFPPRGKKISECGCCYLAVGGCWLLRLHSFPGQKASRHNVLTRVVGTDEQEEFVQIKQPSGEKTRRYFKVAADSLVQLSALSPHTEETAAASTVHAP